MVYINESIAYYTRIQLNNLSPLRGLSSLISSPTYCYVYSESVFWVTFFLKSFFTVMMSFKSLLAELYIGLIMPRMYSWDAEAISELFLVYSLRTSILSPVSCQGDVSRMYMWIVSFSCLTSFLGFLTDESCGSQTVCAKVPQALQWTHVGTMGYFKCVGDTEHVECAQYQFWGSFVSALDWLHSFRWGPILQSWVFSGCCS